MPTNLILPGKNALGSTYLRDTQTLEQWARQPIQQLIAGSGVTLSPSNGLATHSDGTGPHPITISASGGGGGPTSTLMNIFTGPDQADFPYNLLPFSGGWWQSNLQTFVELFNTGSNPDLGVTYGVPFGVSWLTQLAANQTVVAFPRFSGATFTTLAITNYINITGGYFWASNADLSSAMQCSFSVPSGTMVSGQPYQILITDVSINYTLGTDLSLVPGSTGFSDGLVSAAGGVYFGGVSCFIQVPEETTFTP